MGQLEHLASRSWMEFATEQRILGAKRDKTLSHVCGVLYSTQPKPRRAVRGRKQSQMPSFTPNSYRSESPRVLFLWFSVANGG